MSTARTNRRGWLIPKVTMSARTITLVKTHKPCLRHLLVSCFFLPREGQRRSTRRSSRGSQNSSCLSVTMTKGLVVGPVSSRCGNITPVSEKRKVNICSHITSTCVHACEVQSNGPTFTPTNRLDETYSLMIRQPHAKHRPIWQLYIQTSRTPRSPRQCSSNLPSTLFQRIKSMGPKIVPLVVEKLAADTETTENLWAVRLCLCPPLPSLHHETPCVNAIIMQTIS